MERLQEEGRGPRCYGTPERPCPGHSLPMVDSRHPLCYSLPRAYYPPIHTEDNTGTPECRAVPGTGQCPLTDAPGWGRKRDDPGMFSGKAEVRIGLGRPWCSMISVLFENDDIIGVDKPEGLASTPVQGGECLLELLSAQYRERLYAVHRLDREASGVILFARTAAAHRWLNEQFSSRSVRKDYLALVHGVIGRESGVIDRPLREFGSGRIGVDLQQGKPSVTEFQVVERHASYTLVRASAHTGRRHQIRAHLYSIGHPIVGDRRYGEKARQRPFPRLMLHAQRIAFHLPSGEEVTVESPVPPSFRAVAEMACAGRF